VPEKAGQQVQKPEDDGFKEIRGSEIVQFKEVNDQVTGTLINIDQSTFGSAYDLEIEPGHVMTVFGTTVLNQKLSKVDLGDVLRITYLGDKTSEKGRSYKNFKVEVKIVPKKR